MKSRERERTAGQYGSYIGRCVQIRFQLIVEQDELVDGVRELELVFEQSGQILVQFEANQVHQSVGK